MKKVPNLKNLSLEKKISLGGDLKEVWNSALKKCTRNGRIATLPDIINMRLQADINPSSVLWKNYFTTSTSEFFGKSKGGNKIIIIAHNIGPLTEIDNICRTYESAFNPQSGNIGGRISQTVFNDLESGKYGDVIILDYETVKFEDPVARLPVSKNIDNLWIRSRLGENIDSYLEKFLDFANKKNREFFCTSSGVGLSDFSFIEDQYKKSAYIDPPLIEFGTTFKCCYTCTPRFFNIDFDFSDGMAYAHLISIGGLVKMRVEGNYFIFHDINCHNSTNHVRLLSI